jgi:hypothetical protein
VRRLVLEDAFVDRSELLDSKIVIQNAPASLRSGRARKREKHVTHHLIGHGPLFDERRVARRKQPSVERGDFEVPRPAACMCKARYRLKALPKTWRGTRGALQ